VVVINQVSSRKFESLSNKLESYIDNNKTGGVIGLVYQDNRIVFCEKFGWQDKEKQISMEFNSIFRIFSMTKPIISTAVLLLLDEDKIQLEDPISKYLPEFTNMKILQKYEKSSQTTKETVTEITILHLLTHISGLSYGFFPGVPIDKLYGETFGYEDENRIRSVLETMLDAPTLKEFSEKLASLPLAFESGTRWWYGFNFDILGYIIEKISGIPLDVFLKERIFSKLGMNDTDFYVPVSKQDRLCKAYTIEDSELVEVPGPTKTGFNQKPTLLSGGAGLVSTVEDYLKFCILLLDEGTYNGKQVLSPSSVELLRSNHLPDGKSMLDTYFVKLEDPELIKKNEGLGSGLGVSVKIGANSSPSNLGEYGWVGAFNTIFRIDPKNNLIWIILTQYCPEDNFWIKAIDELDLAPLVYQGIE
jgi:CubicO group peptidase (beta-lactamase class C family)